MDNNKISYKDSGVNIEEGYKAVDKIKGIVKDTFIPGVMSNIGSFGAMFKLPEGLKEPILVSGTDGVGTKLDIAFKLGKYDTVGIDCVAMCVNDILCHGAKPLFFLDYVACGKLDASVAEQIVKGVADGCKSSSCALIGGETAEMPGFYDEGKYDMAGFVVGVVDKENVIDGSDICEDDVLIGLSSSGVHSNGFSLVRKLVKDYSVEFNGKTIGEELLTPTRIYVDSIIKLMEQFKIKGMAHVTGGGFYENIPRMFKGDFMAVVNKDSYPLPKIFDRLVELGADREGMYHTFNMGIGFVLCVDKNDKDEVLKALIELGEKAYEIGYVQRGEGLCLK